MISCVDVLSIRSKIISPHMTIKYLTSSKVKKDANLLFILIENVFEKFLIYYETQRFSVNFSGCKILWRIMCHKTMGINWIGQSCRFIICFNFEWLRTKCKAIFDLKYFICVCTFIIFYVIAGWIVHFLFWIMDLNETDNKYFLWARCRIISIG